MSVFRGRPPGRTGGMCGSIRGHCSSVRSLGYWCVLIHHYTLVDYLVGQPLSGDLSIVASIVSEFRMSDRLRSRRETRFELCSPAARDAVVTASLPTAPADYPRGIGV